MSDFGIKLCTMYQKTSKNGNTYFFGRMGNTQLTLLFDKKNSEEGKDPVWNLQIQECEWKPEQKPKLTAPAINTQGFTPAKNPMGKPFTDDSDFVDRFARGEA